VRHRPEYIESTGEIPRRWVADADVPPAGLPADAAADRLIEGFLDRVDDEPAPLERKPINYSAVLIAAAAIVALAMLVASLAFWMAGLSGAPVWHA
jgi:hypothetical protein